MISLPFRRSQQGKIDALYGMIVAQARSPAFYLGYGVPDTVSARLDMILLHLVLLLRRVAATGATATIGQPLFDRFCKDIDDNLREMGVGDLAVPRQMRRVAEGFYGRAKAYDDALAADDAALVAAVARNVYGIANPQSQNMPMGARRLAAYMREAASALARQDAPALARAEPICPDPEAIASPVEVMTLKI
jgi:cytochrome b pre-mRNA-processing protein 3